LLWIVGMMIAAVLLSGCQATTRAATSEPLSASGTIRAMEVRVASELGGRILEVRTEVGAQVQAGDVLVVLDETLFLLQLSPAEAAVATAQADLAVIQAGPRPEEIAAARAALALATAQRDGALSAWENAQAMVCLLYTSPSPRDQRGSRMPSSA